MTVNAIRPNKGLRNLDFFQKIIGKLTDKGLSLGPIASANQELNLNWAFLLTFQNWQRIGDNTADILAIQIVSYKIGCGA